MVHVTCVYVMSMTQTSPGEGVIISASGNHVTKAVTVVELLKRKLQVSHL